MKKLIAFSIILFLFSNQVKSQEDLNFLDSTTTQKPVRKLSDKVVFGGNFGLSFGSVTNITLNPNIGYKLNSRIVAGVGISYQYLRNSVYEYEFSIYGGSVFGQIVLMPQLFIHAEAEALNIDMYDNIGNAKGKRGWIDSYLVGAGYRQQISERGSINYMILWNLNETANSPYVNPVFRFSFNF